MFFSRDRYEVSLFLVDLVHLGKFDRHEKGRERTREGIHPGAGGGKRAAQHIVLGTPIWLDELRIVILVCFGRWIGQGFPGCGGRRDEWVGDGGAYKIVTGPFVFDAIVGVMMGLHSTCTSGMFGPWIGRA